jgi:hypothetical protein
MMLLGLLSVVTGATSVKGMGELNDSTIAVAYGQAMTKIEAGILDLQLSTSPLFDAANMAKNVATIIQPKTISPARKSEFAALYACLQISRDSEVPAKGIVDLSGTKIKLEEKDSQLVKMYYILFNAEVLKLEAPKQAQPGFIRGNYGKIIATTALLAGAAAAVYYGSGYLKGSTPATPAPEVTPAPASEVTPDPAPKAPTVSNAISEQEYRSYMACPLDMEGHSKLKQCSLAQAAKVAAKQAELAEQARLAAQPTIWSAAADAQKNLLRRLTLGYLFGGK